MKWAPSSFSSGTTRRPRSPSSCAVAAWRRAETVLMTVLGIDTATSRGSVALARPGEVLAAVPLLERGAHARDLLLRIDGLLQKTGLRPSDLHGLAVTVGPGSFTGVRIGLSTAKGFAYSLGIGLAGLSTLEALARAAAPVRGAAQPPLVCATIEAGRREGVDAPVRLGGRGTG